MNNFKPSYTNVLPGEYELAANDLDIAINLFNMYELNAHKSVPDVIVKRILNLEYSTLVCSGNYNY